MKLVHIYAFTLFTFVIFLIFPTKINAQVCQFDSIGEWSINPSEVTVPPANEITVTIQSYDSDLLLDGANTELFVSVGGRIENGSYVSLASATIIAGGNTPVTLTIPALAPAGQYDVVIGDLIEGGSIHAPCSDVKTITITREELPPPEGCLSVGQECAIVPEGESSDGLENLVLPLCSPDTTFCKPNSPTFWLGKVSLKGLQGSRCLYDPEREGQKYYCTAGTATSQDQDCQCTQTQLDRTVATADRVGLGCSPREGHVNSAIGCIPYLDFNLLSAFFIRWSVGVGGGIALFIISLSAIRILTTKGDPKRLQDARDSLSSALAGIIFLVLSIFIVRFVADTLLQLF